MLLLTTCHHMHHWLKQTTCVIKCTYEWTMTFYCPLFALFNLLHTYVAHHWARKSYVFDERVVGRKRGQSDEWRDKNGHFGANQPSISAKKCIRNPNEWVARFLPLGWKEKSFQEHWADEENFQKRWVNWEIVL